MSPDTYSAAPVAKTIAGVVTYGLNQLQPAPDAAQVTALDQAVDGVVGEGVTAPPESEPDFVDRWAAAMGREMGADLGELERFALTLGEAPSR
jgi:hypothetical protein